MPDFMNQLEFVSTVDPMQHLAPAAPQWKVACATLVTPRILLPFAALVKPENSKQLLEDRSANFVQTVKRAPRLAHYHRSANARRAMHVQQPHAFSAKVESSNLSLAIRHVGLVYLAVCRQLAVRCNLSVNARVDTPQ